MSDEPLRLLDDPGTPELLREHLEKERSAPWEYDAIAGLASLRAAIQGGGPLPDGDGPGGGGGSPNTGPPQPSPPTAPPPSIGAAAAKGGIAAKGLLVGLAAVGVAAGLSVAAAHWSSEPSPSESTPALPSPAVTAIAGGAATASSPDIPPEPSSVLSPALLSAPGESGKAPAKTAPSASRDQRNAEEIAQMITLREKATGDPASALRLADEGQQKYAGGLFSIEREFIAIDSLARLGRTADAKRRGERFIAAHPSGPYADRVRAVIGEVPQTPSP